MPRIGKEDMNRLASESSPYLLLHKDDLVDWHPWGAEALAASEASGKPILLSIGYTACHWCHQMQRESFMNSAIAAFMNENFVNVMVDREERPDIDQIYQAAANLMGHAGGWPLTAFLTPKQLPFVIGTYFPTEERAGMSPPIQQVMESVLDTFRNNPEAMQNATESVVRELNNLWHRDMRGQLDSGTLDSAAVRIGQRFDLFFGGVLGQMKFPQTTLLDCLWRAFLRTGMSQFITLASTALDNMLLGGLWDHVGGGFSRYCQDERWLVPHWEKQLSDQGTILDVMTSVWQFNRNALCTARIVEQVEFLLRDMKAGDAFAASIDADSEGEEGKYYLWTEAEIDAALMGTFVAKFKTVYNVQRDGNYLGKNILQRLGSAAPFPQSDADEALLAKQRALLLKARQDRVPPRRDDKILADANGLVITALANAGAAMQRTDWVQAAIAAFDHVVKVLGDGDKLHHSWIGGKRGPRGFAEDYSHMARAALALYEITSEKRFLEIAQKWVHTLNTHFWDAAQGGYLYTSEDAEALIVRSRMVFDQNGPSGNGMMIQVLARLMMATNDQQYSDRINTLVNTLSGEAQRAFISMGSYYAGFEFALTQLHLVVVGPLGNPKTHELTNAIWGRALPNRFLTVVSPDDAFPAGHPMQGKGMQNGQPTAYVVQRGQVSAPITNPVTLSQMLQLPQRPAGGGQPQ